MPHPVSPLAPKTVPDLPPIAGVRIATAEAGIRYAGRTDVLYMTFPQGAAVAGVFTRSRCPSAAVDWCRTHLTAGIAARAAGCSPDRVFLASTGVIGEPLEASKFEGVLEGCEERADESGWLDAAKAIMTTDTFPKVATRTARLGDVDVTI